MIFETLNLYYRTWINQPIPRTYNRMKRGMSYSNAIRVVSKHPGLTYVECRIGTLLIIRSRRPMTSGVTASTAFTHSCRLQQKR
jgi:hypothetical protein